MKRSIFFISTLTILTPDIKASPVIHECLRPCVLGGVSRICTYRFNVGKTRNITAGGTLVEQVINGASPGPPIDVCLGDTVKVIVENKLSSEQVNFHWHGLRQKASSHMDGVPMISQCPILPYTSFRYEFKPESSGTFFYHAHSVRQQGDGLYGSLTVRDSSNDLITERILLVSARPSSPLSRLIHLDPPVPDALILNGQVKDVNIDVRSGRKYYLRLINANVFNCPIFFSIAQHNLDIIANDGHVIDGGVSAARIIIFPGERFDLTVDANQTPGRYVIGVQGLEDCRGLIHEAFLNYDENSIESSSATTDNRNTIRIEKPYLDEHEATPINDCYNKLGGMKTICSLDLKGKKPLRDVTNQDVTTFYVPFDVNSYDAIHDEMTDYSFNIYSSSYYPSFLSTPINGTLIGQINGMTFEYPSSPILSQPEALAEDKLCSIENRAKDCQTERQFFCQCTQILQLPPWKTVDIVLIDEGFGGNVSQTFHVHGYDVEIVGIGQFNRAIRKEDIIRMNDNGALPRNTRHQNLRKDSFVVPNKGYIILRIHTDNIGYWLWEARSTGVKGPPMQFIMLVGSRENMPTVPIDFPTCGNHKSQASIFEDTD